MTLGIVSVFNADALYSSPTAWEYDLAVASPVDLRVDPNAPTDPTKSRGCARWFEVVAGGDITFLTAGNDTVTFSAVPAGRAYSIQVVKIISATGKVRVGW